MMFRRIISIVLLLFVVSLSMQSIATASDQSEMSNNYWITTPYDYPVLPGSTSWENMNLFERIDSCFVNRVVAKAMTTDALLKTVLNYPFMININLGDNLLESINTIRKAFPPLDELINRPDAIATTLQYMSDCEHDGDLESIDYVLSKRYHIVGTLLNYLYNYRYSSDSPMRYYVDPIYGFKYDFLSTPNNSSVFAWWNFSWSEVNTYLGVNLTANTAYTTSLDFCSIYGATIVSNPDPEYNCHSYAWHSTSTSNHYWIEDPTPYYTDGSYSQTSTYAVNRKVTYSESNSSSTVLVHSGIITGVVGSTVTVTSKWGALAVFEHSLGSTPYNCQAYYNGNSITYKYYA